MDDYRERPPHVYHANAYGPQTQGQHHSHQPELSPTILGSNQRNVWPNFSQELMAPLTAEPAHQHRPAHQKKRSGPHQRQSPAQEQRRSGPQQQYRTSDFPSRYSSDDSPKFKAVPSRYKSPAGPTPNPVVVDGAASSNSLVVDDAVSPSIPASQRNDVLWAGQDHPPPSRSKSPTHSHSVQMLVSQPLTDYANGEYYRGAVVSSSGIVPPVQLHGTTPQGDAHHHQLPGAYTHQHSASSSGNSPGPQPGSSWVPKASLGAQRPFHGYPSPKRRSKESNKSRSPKSRSIERQRYVAQTIEAARRAQQDIDSLLKVSFPREKPAPPGQLVEAYTTLASFLEQSRAALAMWSG